jgi:hypothetical protein
MRQEQEIFPGRTISSANQVLYEKSKADGQLFEEVMAKKSSKYFY